MTLTHILHNSEETQAFGASLYQKLPAKCLVFLQGQLGAGKTTLVRGLLRSAGYQGSVKSPTFTLVEEYALAQRQFFHFDLYRVNDPEELIWMGMEDYLMQDAICLVEWPEQGQNFLPKADLHLKLEQCEAGRLLTVSVINPQLTSFF